MGDRAPPRGFDDRFPRGREMAGFGDRPRGPKGPMHMRGGGPEPGMNGGFGPGPRGRPMGPHDGPREPFPGRPFGPRSPSPRGRFDPREPGRPGPPVREMVEYLRDRVARDDIMDDVRRDFPRDMEGRRGDFPRDMEGRRGDFPREMEGRPRGDFPREMEGRPRGDFPMEGRQRGEFPMEGRPRGEFPMEGRPRGEFPMEGRPRGEFPREMDMRPRVDVPRDIDARRGEFGREMDARGHPDLMEGRRGGFPARELDGGPRGDMDPRRGDFARGADFPREKEAALRGDFAREMDPRRGEFPRDMEAMRSEYGRPAEGGRGADWMNELEGRRADIDGRRAELAKHLDRRPDWPREGEGRRDWDKELIARRAELQKEMEARRGADWLPPRRSRSRSPLRHPHPSPMGMGQRPAPASMGLEGRPRAPDKPLQTHGLKVQNFPVDVPDEVLQQTLFQKFRKYGFVSTVEVHGHGEERYALVFFYRQQDQVDALIKGRRDDLLGRLVKITPYIGGESKSSGRPLTGWDERTDEFHPRASRTLLIINLDRTITPEKLGNICERFGDVLDVEMSRPPEGEPTRSAFVEFCDMISVCRAGKALDGELVGKFHVKTEFGKSVITNCVWLDGLPFDVTQEYIVQRLSRHGQVAKAVYDRLRGRALVLYTRKEDAVTAVQETKGTQISGWRIKVDFASDRARLAFCRDMVDSGQDAGDFIYV
ncbi:death-inducer obliterator 1-like [Ambystoma mexicanum]|uniref:death-inducer obliterator 1-like n=1 Tax=Ambystoma mexicanum TaxID=8296 RepID=UPI0037E9A1CB